MNVEDLEINEVSPDEDDRAAERLIRNHWHTGERFVIDQTTHINHLVALVYQNIPFVSLTPMLLRLQLVSDNIPIERN